ncbi:lysophospholipid acyltransferase family protein [Stenomitos frigidus]|uniref:1-acyl-sn-glycerol-3-phosphate acyltransferase n=1 Tax=Stenomitos frigidus ULC18 TaxID=2107698 RepID=A0A2T1DTY8_9CYAN|nr:lysophospholipid acyltransferase family protein [Stenomitos frigidus]PSB23969.1 1-acyl-sn-glycerol-3-phosphate acyltransferase [Stenomitos frigidus ULC18]
MNSLDPTRPLYAVEQLPTDSDTQVSPLGYEQKLCQEYVHTDDVDIDVPVRQAISDTSLVVRLLKGTAPHGKAVAVPAASQCSSWLASLVYPLGRYLVVPFYFGRIEVVGHENLPRSGPVILAPTHRSRWDAVMVPYAAGHDITGRHLRFMVSADEVRGLQGWFIQRLGGFPIDTSRPAIASLRHGVDLLQDGQSLVIFPEGNIFRETQVQRLKPGLARLALQAEASHPNLDIKVVPIRLYYSRPFAPWRCRVKVCIGQPLRVAAYNLRTPKQSAQLLTADLKQAIEAL